MARRWPHRLRKSGLWSLAVLVALGLVLSAVGVAAVRRPFPSHAGEAALPGLSAPVTVHRDRYGIPQIHAETVDDLFRAQGYVHAQDRFWEMDFRRHLTAGRLSELFGPGQVETDVFLRTLGWRRVAAREWAAASPETRRYLTAYAEGVNAWVAETGGPAATGAKALQYRMLGLQRRGYRIAPWHPVDSIAWLKAMAWDLRGNLEAEIERLALTAHGLTRDQVEELFPPYPFDRHRPQVPGGAPAAGGRGGGAGGQGGEAGAGGGPPVGSNSWVVSGAHTASGAPILVNDPHLGAGMPNIWYQVGLHCACGYRVSGFSFSGLPGVIIGHNDRIAWGFTNLNPDVTDLYLERLDGDRYLVDGEWADLAVHEETVRVAGGEDVTVRIRQTRHGPLLSDADEDLRELAADPAVRAAVAGAAGGTAPPGDGEYGLALRWTALDPGTTIQALFALNRARDWDGFRAAAARFEVPAQNLTYADVDGNIGYQAPGTVPVRGAGDGRWPAPGWDPAYDWAGAVPFAELPRVRNPAGGRVVSANQAVAGPPYPHLLTTDWGYGFRSERIHALLDGARAAGPLDVPAMARIQMDDRNANAAVLVPALLAAATTADAPPRSRAEEAALDLLRDWDFRQPTGGEPGTAEAASAAGAAYYNAVWRHLLLLTFDELPADHRPFGGGRWYEVVAGLLAAPEAPWWDRVDTAAVETRDRVLVRALADAHRELAVGYGGDPATWRWGELHTLTLRDSTFGSSGIGPVEALFNHGPVAVSGGGDIVNATGWDAAEGYEVLTVPSMRMVVDVSDLDGARWIQVSGNSGHPYHRNYTDQLELWRTGGTIPWRWEPDTIAAEATATLLLRPPI